LKFGLPAHEVHTTPGVNNKENISFTVIVAAECDPPVVNNEILTLFQGLLS